MSEIRKIYYSQLKLPVYAYEKQHKRRVRTPPAFRYGKHWESTSNENIELLKTLYNMGLKKSDFDFSKGGMQHGFLVG